MTKVAMIEYWTTTTETLIFLMKKGMVEPLLYRVQNNPDQRFATQDYLTLCEERLILDFHGLPENWDEDTYQEHFKQILSLPPMVHSSKRSKEILQGTLKKPAFAYTLDYWENLSDVLLPPDLKLRIVDCDLLCFVPHGPLHALPFAALRWSEQEYLIEHFGICYVPSASVLRYCRAKNRKRVIDANHQPESCLVVAVAAADDANPHDFETDGDTLTQLFLERVEGAKVKKLIGKGERDGVQPADKVLFQEVVADYDVIHLACHGIFGMDEQHADPLDSGLLLSDGGLAPALKDVRHLDPARRASSFLQAREIFNLNLTADLVTLRACSSGRAQVKLGDELLGLTRAFLFAGAVSLVVSLWNVNIRSSQRLLNEFYRLWLSKPALPKWQALQQAQISLLRDSELRHPYHWAPFVLVGDWI